MAAKDDVCDKHPFAVRFYFSSLFTPIENMRVMPSQSLVAVGEEVSFHIAVSVRCYVSAFDYRTLFGLHSRT